MWSKIQKITLGNGIILKRDGIKIKGNFLANSTIDIWR